MRYNWQDENWPNFTYTISDELHNQIYDYVACSCHLAGKFSHINHQIKDEALVDIMVDEAIQTSAIEGEHFDDEDVRSSIRHQLGLSDNPKRIKDISTMSLAKLMIDVRETFHAPLSESTLFRWHELIIADPLLRERIPTGQWRTESVQIVSGPKGNERVHFETPPAQNVPLEMSRFIHWFNSTDPQHGSVKISGPVRAALVHIYFESIHPFVDGNGRIGRALSEKALSQDLKSPVLLSLSHTIHAKKKEYYRQLSSASTYGVEVTAWIDFFVNVIWQAQKDAESDITYTLQKANFFDRYDTVLNDRQRKIIKKMFDAGPAGFIGGMSAKKYITITDCSKATATRDLSELLLRGCLKHLEGKGRSVRYILSLDVD